MNLDKCIVEISLLYNNFLLVLEIYFFTPVYISCVRIFNYLCFYLPGFLLITFLTGIKHSLFVDTCLITFTVSYNFYNILWLCHGLADITFRVFAAFVDICMKLWTILCYFNAFSKYFSHCLLAYLITMFSFQNQCIFVRFIYFLLSYLKK